MNLGAVHPVTLYEKNGLWLLNSISPVLSGHQWYGRVGDTFTNNKMPNFKSQLWVHLMHTWNTRCSSRKPWLSHCNTWLCFCDLCPQKWQSLPRIQRWHPHRVFLFLFSAHCFIMLKVANDLVFTISVIKIRYQGQEWDLRWQLNTEKWVLMYVVWQITGESMFVWETMCICKHVYESETEWISDRKWVRLVVNKWVWVGIENED